MKRTFAKLLSLFVVLTLVIAMVPAVFAVDGTVSVTAGNTTLKVGNTTTVSVTDADGNAVTGVTLTSDHTDIVSVIDSSTIKALKVGSATITETTEANGDKIKKVTAGTVKGSTAGAFGYKNTVTTDNAYVVGNNSAASADGAMVLGSSASVTGKNAWKPCTCWPDFTRIWNLFPRFPRWKGYPHRSSVDSFRVESMRSITKN